jgi:hypothetical protein
MSYKVRDDYPKEKIKDFIKTCEKLVEQKGICCVDLDCNDCPAFSPYNDDIDCLSNGFSGINVDMSDKVTYLSAQEFLKVYKKKGI